MTNTIFDKLVTVVALFVFGTCLVTLSWLSKSDEVYEQRKLLDYCYAVTVWEIDRDMGVDAYDRKGHPNFNRVDCGEVME